MIRMLVSAYSDIQKAVLADALIAALRYVETIPEEKHEYNVVKKDIAKAIAFLMKDYVPYIAKAIALLKKNYDNYKGC